MYICERNHLIKIELLATKNVVSKKFEQDIIANIVMENDMT